MSAAGFVVGEYIEGEDWEIIVRWLEDKQIIGFHTYSGQDIFGMPMEAFVADIIKGKESVEDLVTTYRQTGRYFRFPFLHYAQDARARTAIVDRLIDQGIRIAHVSVTVEDFVFNLSLEKVLKRGDSLGLGRLRQEYLEHFRERLAYAERLAAEVAGRPIRHILQLRCNRINSMFLFDILGELSENGYGFISLRDALRDKIYRKEESYFGPRGYSYLERIKNSE